MDIKHIFYEDGVKKIYKLIVVSGQYQGEYIIEKPDGWSTADSIVNIDEELFNVKDFIIGENEKLRFWENSMPEAFNVIKNVFEEQKGDAYVIFKWIAVKNGVEYDLLQDKFELNFNKYSFQSGKSRPKIEIELRKSEARNKLLTRDETTIDLFAEKDLDENVITPVDTFTLGYKKGDKTLSNFYSYDISQSPLARVYRADHFISFARSDEFEFGDNTNNYAGYKNYPFFPYHRIDQGPFVYTNITLKKIKIEISNFHMILIREDGTAPDAALYAVVKTGNSVDNFFEIQKATTFPEGAELKIDRKDFFLPDPYENLKAGQSLSFLIMTNDINDKFDFIVVKTNTSIEISTNMESPLVKTRGIRLIDAFKQLVKNYTSSALNVTSKFIGPGGTFFNTSISTGVFLRGLPPRYIIGQKIKTSMKNMLTDGAAKLLTLGYDIIGNDVVIEDINYFFKDVRAYDLKNKQYLAGYKIDLDKDVTFNTLQFGSKKYSTKIKDDIRNFTTTAEFATPISTLKNKFDKQTELIVDEYKIQELIEDQSTATNDNDDDLVMIDMVELGDYWDNGIFENCSHANVDNKLVLTCTITAFDTTMIEVGSEVQIMQGINSGTWIVLSIEGAKMTLNKTSGILQGVTDTPIRYKIPLLIKNRSLNDGFTDTDRIRNPETATNARHNPKYHMSRWFPFFGSGLSAKKGAELIKVTNYKNESQAAMTAASQDLSYELQGPIVVGSDEPLSRLRDNTPVLFSGQIIDISFTNVTFEEFITLYENWRYGINNNRMNSRGYISINSPIGLLDVYLFGDNALSHSRKNNVLGIKGKIKGPSVEDPVLLSVVQKNKNTLTLTWDYVDAYVDPLIDIQYSLDGESWITVKNAYNVKEVTFTENYLLNLLKGTEVMFRIRMSSSQFHNRISNIQTITWKFNEYVISEVRRTENIGCTYSELVFDVLGNGDFDIKWDFSTNPGGGSASCVDNSGFEIVAFATEEGSGVSETKHTPLTVVNEKKTYMLRLYGADSTADLKPLNCYMGSSSIAVSSGVLITFKNTATLEERSLLLSVLVMKYYD